MVKRHVSQIGTDLKQTFKQTSNIDPLFGELLCDLAVAQEMQRAIKHPTLMAHRYGCFKSKPQFLVIWASPRPKAPR